MSAAVLNLNKFVAKKRKQKAKEPVTVSFTFEPESKRRSLKFAKFIDIKGDSEKEIISKLLVQCLRDAQVFNQYEDAFEVGFILGVD